MKADTLSKTGALPPAPVFLPEVITCTTKDEPNGWVTASVKIPPEIAKRLKGRAFHQDLGEYLNENIIKRSIEGHVF
jgi:hypothetical protein